MASTRGTNGPLVRLRSGADDLDALRGVAMRLVNALHAAMATGRGVDISEASVDCNGRVELCDRRVDLVAGSHNAIASTEPGRELAMQTGDREVT